MLALSSERSEFEQKVSTGQVRTATMLARDSVMTGELVDGTSFTSTFPKEYSDNLTQTLLDKNVELKVDAQRDTVWLQLLYQYLPILLLVGATTIIVMANGSILTPVSNGV